MPSNNWRYDAFISYHDADEAWVWNWLIPRLTKDNVLVCTKRNFDIGIPWLTNMERAVTVSHYTLLVLSPDWMENEWNVFEGNMIQHIALRGLRQRMLPLLHRPCVLPARFEMLTSADFTHHDVETPYHSLVDTLHGRPSFSDLEKYGASISSEPPPIAPATARQAALGFLYDPFAFPFGEDIPPKVLEETFIFHDGFAEHIMNLEHSAVLLAPTGGGKTASRRLMEAHLERSHTRALTGDISGPSIAALTVIYNDFEALEEHLPDIRISHHIAPLLEAIAEAVYNHIIAHADRFMSFSRPIRDWWWSFLDIYVSGEPLDTRLTEHRHLYADYRERVTKHRSAFRANSTFRTVLTTLVRHLRDLQIDRMFILVDEMDTLLEIQSQSSLAAVVKPLLRHISRYILPNVIWKFFLPDEITQVVSAYQNERIALVAITWNGHAADMPFDQELAMLLRQRLIWASEGKISDLDGLASQELARTVDVEQDLVEMALRHRRPGPRALLELGSQLLETMQGQQISLREWEDFKRSVA